MEVLVVIDLEGKVLLLTLLVEIEVKEILMVLDLDENVL